MQWMLIVVMAVLTACASKPKTHFEKSWDDLVKRSQRGGHPHRNESQCASRKDPKPLDHSFAATDFDKNKEISKVEFHCKSIHWFGQLDKDKDHHVHVKSEVHGKHHKSFTPHAHQETGKLNIVQYMKAMDRLFASVDKDESGTLNAKEYSVINHKQHVGGGKK